MMAALLLNISGNWAHFRKCETNNNPLSHDFITKTALIGLIGAVIGYERSEMKDKFPILSEDLIYSVAVNNAVVKESWGFTLRSIKEMFKKSRWQIELLKNPDFDIVIACVNDRSNKDFELFCNNIQNNKAAYTPVLGLHNCPANLKFRAKGDLSNIENGRFATRGFFSNKHLIDISEFNSFKLSFDRIPVFENDDFWNEGKYEDVIYSVGNEVMLTGPYYEFKNSSFLSKWYMI